MVNLDLIVLANVGKLASNRVLYGLKPPNKACPAVRESAPFSNIFPASVFFLHLKDHSLPRPSA
jgi:hypothetical protein